MKAQKLKSHRSLRPDRPTRLASAPRLMAVEGHSFGRKLRQGERPDPEAPTDISGEHDKLLLHLRGTPAVQKYDDDRRNDLKFGDACRFWSISEEMQGESLDSKLNRI